MRGWGYSLTGPPVLQRYARPGSLGGVQGPPTAYSSDEGRRAAMSKRGRKRRSRKGNKANHGKRPNA